jgi:hypothetical protein
VLWLLARHFFGRLFDNEIVSQTGDLRTNVVQALGLLAAPGIFVTFYMLPQRLRFDQPFAQNWLLISDCYFFVLYSMVVMGCVMVFEWDMLFPDRRDYLILTPLPLSGAAIFAGKALSLVAFLGLFSADANLLDTALLPMMTSGRSVEAIVLAHIVAVVAGAAFVALAFAGLQGMLMNLLTGPAFRRISPWVQMGAMGVVCLVLFLTPLVCALLRPLFVAHNPIVDWFPPFWFLGLYLDLLPGHPGGPIFHELARRAGVALEIAGAVFVITYAVGYRRHTRRILESLELPPDGPGRLHAAFTRLLNRWLLPRPWEQATFHFISNTILRSARHRLFLATIAGIACALGLLSAAQIDVQHGAATLSLRHAGFAAVAMTVSFFAVTGLRAVFNLPVELRANWIFRLCESDEREAPIRGARKWILSMALAPLLACLLAVAGPVHGWLTAGIDVSFAGLSGLVLLNLLLIWFRKIPFTCSYFPGKANMALMLGVYLAAFTLYCWSMADLVESLIPHPAKLFLLYAGALLALRGLKWLERRERDVDDVLIYEDQPDPVVRTLGIG